MTRSLTLAACLAFAAGAALADINVDTLVADYQAQGFTRIEVRNGLTQTKVEAIRGTEKLEVVLDRATGAVLTSETDAVGAFENTSPGVSIRNRNRDFVKVASAGSDSADDDASDDGVDPAAGDDDGPGYDAGDDNGSDGDQASDDGDDHDQAGHDNSGHDNSGHDDAGDDDSGHDAAGHDAGDDGADHDAGDDGADHDAGDDGADHDAGDDGADHENDSQSDDGADGHTGNSED